MPEASHPDRRRCARDLGWVAVTLRGVTEIDGTLDDDVVHDDDPGLDRAIDEALEWRFAIRPPRRDRDRQAVIEISLAGLPPWFRSLGRTPTDAR